MSIEPVLKKAKIKDYDYYQTIGTGSFGRVKLCRLRLNNEYRAVKILKKHEIIRTKQVDHMISEFQIISMIDHPFITKFHGLSQDERYLYLFSEYVQGGELFSFIRDKFNLSREEGNLYAAQVTLMFEYLHSLNIVYRDLKPENLLISNDGFLKLTDFGFAKILEGRTYTLCGTPEYLAPEILLNKGHGKPVDWWCLGILIYEMHVGIDPFNAEEPMTIYQNILKGKILFPKHFDKDIKSIIKHLLQKELSRRFGNLKNGVRDIKEHRYFKQINWAKLLSKQVKVNHKPVLKGKDDTSCFQEYPDSNRKCQSVKPDQDPFLYW